MVGPWPVVLVALRTEACVWGRGAALCRPRSLLPLWSDGASSFRCFYFCLGPAPLSLGLAAAVTLCVGLTEGFLGLFVACCYGCQLQCLAGWDARQEGGVVRACRLGGGFGASAFSAGVL